MISSNIFHVFLSLVIAAVTQISSGLPELTNGINTREAGYSQSTTTSAMRAQPPVATSTMSIELETSSLPKQENVSNVETKSNSIGLPDTTTLLRTFYVLLAVTAIIIVYFVVRTVRLRMRKNRKTRYGLLSTHDDGLEMRHLDEDEEDATVFDRALAHSRR